MSVVSSTNGGVESAMPILESLTPDGVGDVDVVGVGSSLLTEICAGSASRITLVPSRFNAISNPNPGTISSGLCSMEESEPVIPQVAVFASLRADFPQESVREWARECDLEDFDSVFTREFECECEVRLNVPPLLVPLVTECSRVTTMGMTD